MLYLLFIFLFTLLLLHNLQISKSFLSPSVLFVGVWLVSLIGLFLSGDMLFSISGFTLMIYLVGAGVFSFGGTTGQLVRQHWQRLHSGIINASDTTRNVRYFVMDLFLLGLSVGVPFYWWQVVEQFGGTTSITLAVVRALDVERSGLSQPFSLVRNFPLIAAFLAYALYYENDGTTSRRWRAYLAVMLAVVYGSFLGVKMTAVIVPITALFIASMRAKRLRMVMTSAVFVYALVAFTIGLFLINFAYEKAASIWDLLPIIVETIQSYWLGGLVAFDQIVYDPHIMESTQSLGRFFLETANSLGGQYYVPSLHAGYTNISLNQNTNVYTIYFTYYKDWGLYATVLLMWLAGFVCGYIYAWARSGSPIPVIFYAMLASGILLSIHSEHFFTGLNSFIKAAVFFFFVYHLFPLLGSVFVKTSKASISKLKVVKC